MYIMLTLPYVIRDIAGPERQLINSAIQSAADGDPLRGEELVEDPCEKIVECLMASCTGFFSFVGGSS
jgi:hypothetical protein